MDESQIIKDFEYILRNKAIKPPLALYSDKKLNTSTSFNRNSALNARDIISNVNKQIMNIQKADGVISSRRNLKKLQECKKSSFLNVNMLSLENLVTNQKPVNKFETQCVSDTQLIDLIDNVEAIANSNNGMTQEFDNTFYHFDDKDEKPMENNANNCFDEVNVVVKDNNAFNNETVNNKLDKKDESTKPTDIAIDNNELDEKILANNSASISTNTQTNFLKNVSVSNKNLSEANKTQPFGEGEITLDEVIEKNKGNERLHAINMSTDETINPSPIFQILRSKTPSPLAFDLETFEKFEKIALPIVEENPDLVSAKQLINSQIIGKELLIRTNARCTSYESNEQTSPTLKFSAETLTVTKTTDNDAKVNVLNDNKALTTCNKEHSDNTFLEDEILFSSDEESDYVQKEFQDIPLTCALETSFYEQPDILDKTMYVGFQTASNKSIQVVTDSFTKAKSVLDEIEIDVATSTSLTDLVASLFEKSNSCTNKQTISKHTEVTGDLKNIETAYNDDNLMENVDDLMKNVDETSNRTDKRKLEGFMTSVNKKLKLSDMALARCKHVFKDIDLEDLKADYKDKSTNLDNKELVNVHSQIDDDILHEFSHDMSLMNDDKNEISKTEMQASEIIALKSQHIIDNTKVVFDKDLNLRSESDTKVSKLGPNDLKGVTKINPLNTKVKDIVDEMFEKVPVFGGFKTANNKEVKISGDSLLKTKQIFNDIEKENTKLKVNTKNIEKETNIIQCNEDLHVKDKDVNTFLEKEITEIEIEALKQEPFCGFQTARNKPIRISKKALQDSKSMFSDVKLDDEHVFEKERQIPAVLRKSRTEYMFGNSYKECLVENKSFTNLPGDGDTKFSIKTENNKPVNNSNRILNKISTKYDNEKLLEPHTTNKESTDMFNNLMAGKEADESNNDCNLDVTRFKGFTTANNKPISISSDALVKSKALFKDINNEDTIPGPNKDISNSSKETQQDFGGFQTANNKPINISNVALEKCKALLKDLDYDDNDMTNVKINESKNNPLVSKGFRTAANKNIHISSEALAKSKALFNDLDDMETNANDDSADNKTTAINKLPFEGFKTANNKGISISSEALARSKLLFTEIENELEVNKAINNSSKTIKEQALVPSEGLTKIKGLFNDSTSKTTNIHTFRGFQTGNNKRIHISSEALAKSKLLLEDIDDRNEKEIAKNFNNSATIKTTSVPAFKGFQTANNKQISVSREALAKSKLLFKGIDEVEEKDTKININDSATIKTTNIPKFQGFQTGNNKRINVSSEALAKSKLLFKDIDKVEGKNIETTIDDSSPIKTYNTPRFEGFQTANNKKINVTSEALAKSKFLLKDIDKQEEKDTEITINDSATIKTTCVPAFKGFQTANNKQISVSSEALARSKMLFNDMDNEAEIDKPTDNLKSTSSEMFKGFKTASKKSVSVSSEALAKSKMLFQDIKDDLDLKDNIEGFKGFESRSESVFKCVDDDVNENINKFKRNTTAGLAKSKIILENIESCKENANSHFDGFQTATNRNVKISDQALRRSRQIFQDINMNNENCKNNVMEAEVSNENKILLKSDKDDVKMCQKSFKVSKNILKESVDNNQLLNKNKEQDNNIEKLIDTQIINDFEETMYTEDFCKDTTPRQSKRSSSPILSCPKAKRRRKFETPYKNDGEKASFIKEHAIASNKQDSMIFNNDYKKNKRLNLKHLAKVEVRNNKVTIDPYILSFDLENLLEIEFFGNRNDLTEGKLAITDLKDIFEKVVNKKLIPNGWIENHLTLIIWKLISYEIVFPQTLSRVCTAKNVLEQLKYRFDKELYNAERPALRKILEKDDVASKTMVLCVAGIIADGINVKSVTSLSSNVELLLTDGWYYVKASVDKMLTKLVFDGKIEVGCKIVTNGAELVNCEQGVSPWENTSSIRLKIFGNSTRRARWDARLGYHGNAAIFSQLSSVRVDGGKVSKLRLFVARVYPMLYVEKFEDGSTVTRSERLEHIHQVKYESEKQAAMEKLYEEVEKELSDQESQDSLESQKAAKHRKISSDFGITESQAKSLEDRSNRRRERILLNIQERVRRKVQEKGVDIARNVVTLMKVRVAGVSGGENPVTKGFMSIWKPNDMLTDIIKEGSWIEVMNVVPTAIRYSEIHLTAGRQSIFSQSKYQEEDHIKPHTKSLKRKCYHIKDLAQNPTMTTDYNEIDVVGLIFQIDEVSNQPFQNMYVTDSEKNIICINFWGGLKKFGYQNLLEVGQIIYGTNLQKRAGNTRKSIPHFRVTEFTNFTKTPKNLTARSLIEELENKFLGIDKKKYCGECVILKDNFSTKTVLENVSPYRFNNDHNLTKNKVFFDSPLAAKCDNNFDLTGLDFESTFKQTDTEDLPPKVLERKRIVKQKIARLKMVGEPPPLSPFSVINKSRIALNHYRSPLAQSSVANAKKNYSRTNDIQSGKVVQSDVNDSHETLKNKSCDIEIQSSPIIQIDANRSYQRNVTSVKESYQNSRKEFQSSPLLQTVDKSRQSTDGVRISVANVQRSCQTARIIDTDAIKSSPVISMNRTYVKNVNPVKLNFSKPQDDSLEDVDNFKEEFEYSPPLSLD